MPASPRPSSPIAFAVVALVVAVGGIAAALGPAWASEDRAADAGVRYEAKQADSICGLDDVRVLSSPARVRHEELLDATPERERMRRERLDPASPMGQILEAKARRRVTAACASVMRGLSHCSVWKSIRRSDGRPVPDITPEVRAALARVTPDPGNAAD